MYLCPFIKKMGQEKTAILDLGTNTFHLLITSVTDGGYTVLLKKKIPVKIGEGGISRKLITKAARQRAIDAIRQFREIIDHYEVTEIFAFATSAIRSAADGRKLLHDIYKMTGIEIKIISGLTEAQYIYTGVKQAVELEEHPSLIMDIGGGSVEFIIGNAYTVLWKKSFEIGAQRLNDKFHKHDPARTDDIDRLNKYLEKELRPLFKAAKTYEPTTLVGSSGTFDTINEIYVHKHKIIKDPNASGFQVPVRELFEIYDELVVKNRAERLAIPGMIEMRVDMIVMSVALARFVTEKLGILKLKTSTYSLKEGILHTIIEKKQVKQLSA